MTKKLRFIENNPLLSEKGKKKTAAFFDRYPNYEKFIDWNKKIIAFNDFKKVFRMAEKSNKNKKRITRENPRVMFKKYQCDLISETDDFLIIIPNNWSAAVFFNSFRCGGEGANWCIGNKDSPHFWEKYINNGTLFYFVFFKNKNTLGKKLMIEYNGRDDKIYLWLQDGRRINFDRFGYILKEKYYI